MSIIGTIISRSRLRRSWLTAWLVLGGLILNGCALTRPPPTSRTTGALEPVGQWVLDGAAFRAQAGMVVARERASAQLDGPAATALLATVSRELDEIAQEHVARLIVYDCRPDGSLVVTDRDGTIGLGHWQRHEIAVDLNMVQPAAYAVRGLLVNGGLVLVPVPGDGDRTEYFISFFRRRS